MTRLSCRTLKADSSGTYLISFITAVPWRWVRPLWVGWIGLDMWKMEAWELVERIESWPLNWLKIGSIKDWIDGCRVRRLVLREVEDFADLLIYFIHLMTNSMTVIPNFRSDFLTCLTRRVSDTNNFDHPSATRQLAHSHHLLNRALRLCVFCKFLVSYPFLSLCFRSDSSLTPQQSICEILPLDSHLLREDRWISRRFWHSFGTYR